MTNVRSFSIPSISFLIILCFVSVSVFATSTFAAPAPFPKPCRKPAPWFSGYWEGTLDPHIFKKLTFTKEDGDFTFNGERNGRTTHGTLSANGEVTIWYPNELDPDIEVSLSGTWTHAFENGKPVFKIVTSIDEKVLLFMRSDDILAETAMESTNEIAAEITTSASPDVAVCSCDAGAVAELPVCTDLPSASETPTATATPTPMPLPTSIPPVRPPSALPYATSTPYSGPAYYTSPSFFSTPSPSYPNF